MKNFEKILIRKAGIDDLGDILRLNFDLFKMEYRKYDKSLNMKWTYGKKGREFFKKRILGKEGFVEVAEIDGRIVGYICGGFRERSARIKARYAELENMLIDKNFRGKRIGAAMVEDFLFWCKRKKANYVNVTAAAGNAEAIEFYRFFGFQDYRLALEKKI